VAGGGAGAAGRPNAAHRRALGVEPSVSAFTQALADGLQPDIMLANGNLATVAVQRETRTIPMVFVNVSDAVASGIVSRLDRPSGNITGFATAEASMAGKWREPFGTKTHYGRPQRRLEAS
jgi:hypothetical protein